MQNQSTKLRWAGITKGKTGGVELKIIFPFSTADLAIIHRFVGRVWHKEEKYWTIPFSMDVFQTLKSTGFVFGEKLLEYVKQQSTQIETLPMKPRKLVEIPGLGGVLRLFQHEGVTIIDEKGGRALLADDMGLGKTVQALAYLQLHPELKERALIVCPASVKYHWERMAKIWLTPIPNVEVLSGETPYPIRGKIVVINYNIIDAWRAELQKFKPLILILDEAHMIKNNSAKRTKAVKMIQKGVPRLLGLTGTPIENRPIEIFNVAKMIDPVNIPEYWVFAQRFCGAKHNGYGWDFSGASNLAELNALLRNTIMIRRLKKDVLTELPPKEYSCTELEITNKKEYEYAEQNFIDYVRMTRGEAAAEKASMAVALGMINTLKQLAAKGKMKAAVEWITDFLESGQKLVVFGHHKETISALIEAFKGKALKIDGSTPVDERLGLTDQFKTDESIRLFVISLAAAEGVDLTAASNIAILEFPWTPGKLDQIIDRLHRMNQLYKVLVHYLVAINTIDERFAQILDQKRKVIDAAIDGVETEESSMLTALINSYLK